jgi:catechol 2,3-dioxygenase-like lactoylglutathione lyase family enzyme
MAGMASPLLLGIDRLVLRVPNVAAATAYYRDVLGLELIREGAGFATLRLGDGKELLLHSSEELPEEAVFLLVDDVNDLYRRRDELRLRFAGKPTRVSRGFKATVKDPFGGVLLLIDRCLDDAAGDAGEDVRTPHALFAGVVGKLPANSKLLAGLYERAGRTADDLPYTPQFEQIFAAYSESFPEPRPDRAETWRHLLNLRKRGDLPKLGAARSRPPVADEQTAALLRQVLDQEFGGRIGRRDRLPYSPEFEQIAESFNRARARQGQGPLAPHQLWRLVALLAK